MNISLLRNLGVSFALVSVLLFVGVSARAADVPAADGKDIVDTAVAADNFKTLATALKAAGLVETLKGKGPFTVFAPTDEAFAKLPKGTLEDLLKPENKEKLTAILTYHVVPGKVMAKDLTGASKFMTVNGKELKIDYKVMVDNANVIKADVAAANGVIHAIDTVLMPKAASAAGEIKDADSEKDKTFKTIKTEDVKASKDIVDTAVGAGNFKTLAAALKAADLVDTLKGKGPFTVFAPTDEAFAKLPKGTLDDLLKPENKEKLKAILTYHVVSGNVMAKDLAGFKTAKTVNGQELKITATPTVGKAAIVKADIACTNGVIHAIDMVLMPPAE